jgi:hypothetical protein
VQVAASEHSRQLAAHLAQLLSVVETKNPSLQSEHSVVDPQVTQAKVPAMQV